MSGRYSIMPMCFFKPSPEAVRKQSKKDKQGRDQVLPDEVVSSFLDGLDSGYEVMAEGYHWATENDIARELARIDLPLSTYTMWYWKIDGHNLLHALGLRCDLHAQEETRAYFNAMAGMAKRLMPVSFEAWEDYHFYGKRFSRQEMEILRGINQRRGNHIHSMPIDVYRDAIAETLGSNTEADEFLAKFDAPSVVDFNLDLSTAQTGEHFEVIYRSAAEG